MKSLRLAAILLIGLVEAARAQTIFGVVRDSASRAPVGGVVVEVRDSAGGVVHRTLTTATGAFEVNGDGRAARLRLVRIGFRPRDAHLSNDQAGGSPLEITMTRLPTVLERMEVVASARCDQRTNTAGLALLQQARAGLLATIVGREVNPAKIVRISYERTYGQRLDTMMPAVRIDSVNDARTVFRAARRGADLVSRGFTADSLGSGIYFAPDAEVLLDEGFEAGYCFHVEERRGQIGLGFFPASSRRIGRVDVEGTLWIDKDERALRTLEYRYVGVGLEAESNNVGGEVVYQEMPNGTVLVSRWSLRLLKVRVDSLRYRHGRLPTGRIVPSEAGGMVARAEWPDGTKWEPPLGILEVTAVDGESGRRIGGAEVRILNTNQAAIADQNGIARFTSVLPGRYAVEVVNRQLDSLGFVQRHSPLNAARLDTAVIRPSLVFADTSSERMLRTVDIYAGRTARQVAPMRTVKQFAMAACRDPRKETSPKRAILGQVVVAHGTGIDLALVRADDLRRRLVARANGAFVLCVPDEWVGPVRLAAQHMTLRSEETIVELGDGVTFVRLVVR